MSLEMKRNGDEMIQVLLDKTDFDRSLRFRKLVKYPRTKRDHEISNWQKSGVNIPASDIVAENGMWHVTSQTTANITYTVKVVSKCPIVPGTCRRCPICKVCNT